MTEKDNIELRNGKVRNIIGQIPPRIIRSGITVIFFVIAGILTGAYFFEYDYIIKTTATIVQHNDTTIIEIKIPGNEIGKIKLQNKVILNFDNIPNLHSKRIETAIQALPNKIEISKNGGYYLGDIMLMGDILAETGEKLYITEQTLINADIITDKISFFDRIIEPFGALFNKKE